MMKRVTKYAVLLLLAVISFAASAQVLNEDTTTNQPFFKASKFNSKCYVGLDASVVQVLKTRATGYFGADLNWVINHKFVVSAIYDGLGGGVRWAENADTIRTIHYVGLGFSYILFDKKLFSFQPGLSAGWGRINYTIDRTRYQNDFAEIVPTLAATYNCTKYFRFGLGLNYHLAVGPKLTGIQYADFSGVGGVLFIKVGTF